jgi:hypothetical protein
MRGWKRRVRAVLAARQKKGSGCTCSPPEKRLGLYLLTLSLEGQPAEKNGAGYL